MSPDLAKQEPYSVGRAGVNVFTDELDHTMVNVGRYDFDTELSNTSGGYLWEGLLHRCYGDEALNAQDN